MTTSITREANADHYIYTLAHTDTGIVERGKRFELRERLGLGQSGLSLLINGKLKTHHGWCLAKNITVIRNNINGSVAHRTHTLIHTKTGAVERGKQRELRERLGLDSSSLSILINGKLKAHHGWRLATPDEASFNQFDDSEACKRFHKKCMETTHNFLSRSNADPLIHTLIHTKTNAVERGKRVELQDRLGFNSSKLSELITGKIKTSKGWRLEKNFDVVRDNIAHNTHVLVHTESGIIGIGEQYELCKKFGLSSSGLSSLIKGRYKTHKGWRMATPEESTFCQFDDPAACERFHKKCMETTHNLLLNPNPNADQLIHTLIHTKTKIVERGKRVELQSRLDLRPSSLSMLINGKLKKYKGWCLAKNIDAVRDNIDDRAAHSTHVLAHTDSGIIERGEQCELREKLGLSPTGLSMLINGKLKTHHGWRLATPEEASFSQFDDQAACERFYKKCMETTHNLLSRSNADQLIYTLIHTKTKIVELGTRVELRSRLGFDHPSLSKLINGKLKTHHGWRLATPEEIKNG